MFAQIIDRYIFCYSSIKLLKEFYMTEYAFIYTLQEYKLLSKYQFGFMSNSATSYAVESIYSNLLSNADNGLYSCSIFLDLSKTFETVNHNILFEKFYHNFGIRGIPLQLFRSYLSNCKQFVELENVQSGLDDMSNGVTQGLFWERYYLSCTLMIYLNPVYFILYYMLMIFIFVYLIKILTVCSIW